MFYDKNKVNNAFLCKNCQEQLDEPKILPCGKTVCSFCASKIKINGNQFDCIVCKNKHEMPKNGFIVSEALLELLSVKPTSISRGSAYDSLEKSLNNIQKKKMQFKLGIENRNDSINEHCVELRSDVQLATEELILQINDFSSKMIEEIDEYENELIELNKTNYVSLDEFNNMVKELESFHKVNIEYLKQYKVDDKLLIKSNEEANILIKKAEQELQKLKDVIFDRKILKFEKNSDKINNSILGVILNSRFDSFILSEIKDLMLLCEFPVDQKWALIYRATQDGFEASQFHSKCDDKPNTLIIIKSTNDNIFGGYTEHSWSGLGFKVDPNAFIFSLINEDSEPLKIKWSKNKSITCNNECGPIFGGSGIFDLIIQDKSNLYSLNSSDLGQSYTHPDYSYRSNEARSFLAGSYQFQVSEIEVFTKQ